MTIKPTPHTSKVGYYVRQQNVVWYRSRNGSTPRAMTSNVTTGISFRSAVHKSDGVLATNYGRSIITATSLGGVDIRDSVGWRITGDTGFHANGVRMNSQPWGQIGLPSGFVNPPEYLRANAILQAKSSLHGNTANILEDLAQAGQMAKDAAALFKKIGKATSIYLSVLEAVSFWDKDFGRRHRSRGGPKRNRLHPDGVIRTLAQAWLVWYYAVKPLIGTLNQIGLASQPKTLLITGEGKGSCMLDHGDLFDPAPLAPFLYKDGIAGAEVRCKLYVMAKLSSGLMHLMNLGFHPKVRNLPGDEYGDMLDATDILTTAWAIVPYSFVIDWMVPVENFLRSLYWSPSLEYKHGYISKVMMGRSTAYAIRSGYGNIGSLEEGKRAEGRVEALLFQRETYNSHPPPSVLTVNQSISPSNVISAMALILTRR